jgi:polyisoprenoid-binding protein YceI
MLWVGCSTQPQGRAAGAPPHSAPQASGGTAAQPDAAPSAVEGRVLSLDPAASGLRIYVFRAGRAAKLGHNHVMSAPQLSGRLFWPTSGDVAAARFDVEFRLDQLDIDQAETRAGLGAAFASEVSPEAAAGTREHMLGSDGLQADAYPLVQVRSLGVAGELPKVAAQVRVGLHGRTRDVWVPLHVEGLPQRLSVTGALVVRQSDFGVHPYSVLGGLLAVQDEVLIEFTLVGR